MANDIVFFFVGQFRPEQNGRSYALLIDRDFDAEERLSNFTVEFLRKRLVELGPIESGFYGYYTHLAERGVAFQSYEKALVRFMIDHASGFERYVEIGAGIGQLSALLATHGLITISVEGDESRARAARALRDALAQHFPTVSQSGQCLRHFSPTRSLLWTKEP